MKCSMIIAGIAVPSVNSFVVDLTRLSRTIPTVLRSSPWDDQQAAAGEDKYDDSDDIPPQDLILDNVEGQMAQLRNKYPTSEVDYLAAARARNAAKAQSSEVRATDEDWRRAQREAAAKGKVGDDWENSLGEAGSTENQILIPYEHTPEGEEASEDDDEPRLMLF